MFVVSVRDVVATEGDLGRAPPNHQARNGRV
ncbi:MAG: hypothetical protein JWR28_3326, partial [Modestobacter sp.]|nr:hypothetical protein [Modestobacter sp.]